MPETWQCPQWKPHNGVKCDFSTTDLKAIFYHLLHVHHWASKASADETLRYYETIKPIV